MAQIVSGDRNQKTPDGHIDDNQPHPRVRQERITVSPPESERGGEFDQGILPRDPRAASVALPPLNNETRERDEFVPVKRLTAGEALRSAEHGVTRSITVNGHVQKTADN